MCKHALLTEFYYECSRVGHKFLVIQIPRSLFAISKKPKHRFLASLKKLGSTHHHTQTQYRPIQQERYHLRHKERYHLTTATDLFKSPHER